MSDAAIVVEGLGKRYHIGARQAAYKTFRETLVDAVQSPFRRTVKLLRGQAYGAAEMDETIWALKDVSFEIKQGEVVGIIGRNGAGKSTLLKILSRITEPTEGRADLYGRVGSLLEVGTGFHPELTGRENIYLNGAILGMKRTEIDRKFDEIVAFAEIEKFLDTPVKHYSSGMYVRLAFAVAAHLEPEILFVDEVLAVGDIAFQEKCIGKMKDVAVGGRTVLFVSHNLAAVSNLCSWGIILNNGGLYLSGPVNNLIDCYLQLVRSSPVELLSGRHDRKGLGNVQFTNISIIDRSGNPLDIVTCGQDVGIRMSYRDAGGVKLRNASFSIGIYSVYGYFLLYAENEMSGHRFDTVPAKGSVTCWLPNLPLASGYYDININCIINGIVQDWIPRAGQLKVADGDYFGTGKLPPATHGGFLAQQEWQIEQ